MQLRFLRYPLLLACCLCGMLSTGKEAVKSVPSIAPQAQASDSKVRLDKRLLGRWSSDAKLTAALRSVELSEQDETLEKFELTYGLVHKRFTKTHLETYHVERPEKILKAAYRVVAKDAASVVISIDNQPSPVLQQFFFEKDAMYMLGGYRVEYFKKVKHP